MAEKKEDKTVKAEKEAKERAKSKDSPKAEKAEKPGKSGKEDKKADFKDTEEKPKAVEKPKTDARKKSGKGREVKGKRDAWVDYKPGDVEKLVVDLGNKGHTSAEIGMMLADQYAVPSVKAITGKRIEAILSEHNLLSDVPRDLLNLIRKSVALMKHMEENKKDMSAKRGYQLTVSKIRRLSNYYIKEGRLPKNWRYTPEQARLLVK